MAADLMSLPEALKGLIATVDRLEAAGSLNREGLTAARKEIEALEPYVEWLIGWQTKATPAEGEESTEEKTRLLAFLHGEFDQPIRDYIERCHLLVIAWSEESLSSPDN